MPRLVKGLTVTEYKRLKASQKKNMYYDKRYKRYFHKSSSVAKTLTPAVKKEISEQIDERIDQRAETKYSNVLLNESLEITKDSPDVDLVNYRALVDITPEIANGDAYYQREGDVIDLKQIKIRMRLHPEGHSYTFQQGFPPVNNPFPKIKNLKCYLLRIDRDTNLTAGQLDYCLRRPFENWMDTRQTDERKARKNFNVVGKPFLVPVSYKNLVGLDSSTVPCEWNITNMPQMSFVDKTFHVNKKTIFNNTSLDEPVKYRYKLFFTWGNYLRDAYEPLVWPTLYLWTSYTFKDI